MSYVLRKTTILVVRKDIKSFPVTWYLWEAALVRHDRSENSRTYGRMGLRLEYGANTRVELRKPKVPDCSGGRVGMQCSAVDANIP